MHSAFIRPGRVLAAPALVVLVASLAAACGGGGGGSDPVLTSVTLHADVTAIDEDVFVDRETPVVKVPIHVEGDAARLKGKTLYVLAEGPAAVLQNPVLLRNTDDSFELQMWSTPVTSPAHYVGPLTFHVCLDADGGRELQGSPITVPYDVRVVPGLTLDQETAQVVTTFGEEPPAQKIVFHANLSPYTTSWSLDRDCTPDPGTDDLPFVGYSNDGTVTVWLYPLPPGTYTVTVRVSANVSHGGVSLALERDFVITYVVGENPSVLAQFVPSEQVCTAPYGEAYCMSSPYYVVARTGVTPQGRAVEYLTHPPAADGHDQVNAWYDPAGVFKPCSSVTSSRDCLPAGEYTARVPWDMIVNGVTVGTEYLPVKLTVEP